MECSRRDTGHYARLKMKIRPALGVQVAAIWRRQPLQLPAALPKKPHAPTLYAARQGMYGNNLVAPTGFEPVLPA